MEKNRIEPARPSGASLETRQTNLHLSNSGSNKSVWQSFVDAAGFVKRHPTKKRRRRYAKIK